MSYVIPPALGKVGQLMLKSVLQKLEHDANDCAQPPVSYYDSLDPPAEEVSRNE